MLARVSLFDEIPRITLNEKKTMKALRSFSAFIKVMICMVCFLPKVFRENFQILELILLNCLVCHKQCSGSMTFLVWIRIRGSMPLTNGSGSGSWIRILLFS
jgi:hypothetical protein